MTDIAIIPPSGATHESQAGNAGLGCDEFALCTLEATARRLGLAAVDVLALRVLEAREGRVGRATLVRELLIDGPACSRLLNRLETADFAVRLCGDDRRTLEVELLDDGWDIAEQAQITFSECAEDLRQVWIALFDGNDQFACADDVLHGEGGEYAEVSHSGAGKRAEGFLLDSLGNALGECDKRTCLVSFDDAVAANRALAQLQSSERLTRTQSLCLMVGRLADVNTFAPSAASILSRATSLPRTTVRSTLWTLQGRGLL